MKDNEMVNNVSIEAVKEVEVFYKEVTKVLGKIDTEAWYLNQDFTRYGHMNKVRENAFITITEKIVELKCQFHKRIYDLHTWIVEQEKLIEE